MRASWAAFPMLAPGEFLSSPSACDRPGAKRFTEQPANVFSCFLLCCLSEPDLFILSSLLLTPPPFLLAPLNKSSHLSAAVLG